MANVVEILVTARNLARPALTEATADARGLSGVMGKTGAVATAALAGIAVESVKMASSFQSSTTRLVTSAGESNKNIDLVRKGMLKMASDVGVGANELAKGMYTVESAGYHGADGLKVLKASAEGAKAEGADLTTVANAVTDALKDYHEPASAAGRVTSQLIAAVSHGKTNFEDFSGAMATVLPMASEMGIKLSDVAGTMAEVTSHGVSAKQAAIDIRQAMSHLLAPTTAQIKEFDALGISSQDVSQHLSKDGLAGTMQWLNGVAEDNAKAIGQTVPEAQKKLIGSLPALQAMQTTTGKNFKDTTKAIKDTANATTDSAGKVKGFAEVQKTLGQQVSQLKAGFETLMIELGTKLIPVLTKVVSWMNKNKDVVVVLLGVLGGLLVAFTTYSIVMKTITIATKLWAAAQWLLNAALNANPVSLVIIALAALGVAIAIAWNKSQTFRDIVLAAWDDVKLGADALVRVIVIGFKFMLDTWMTVVGGILKGAADAFSWVPGLGGKLKTASAAFNGLKSAINSDLNGIITKTHQWDDSITKAARERTLKANISSWTSQLEKAKKELKSVPSSKKAKLEGEIADLERKISKAKADLASVHGKTVTMTLKVGTAGMPADVRNAFGFAHGGVVGAAAVGGPRSGMVMVGEHGPELVSLPAGSTVHSNPDTQRMMAGGGGGGAGMVQTHIYIDGKSFMTAVTPAVRETVKRISGGNVQKAFGY